MLYASILLSLALFLAVNALVFLSKATYLSIIAGIVLCILGILATCFVNALFPLMLMQAAITGGALLTLHKRKLGFSVASVVAMLFPYGLAGYGLSREQGYYTALREEYPFERMEERVPSPGPENRTPVLKLPQEKSLTKLEDQLKTSENGHRSFMLQLLHEDSTRSFEDSVGFGVGRRIRPSTKNLKFNLPRYESIPHPGPPAASVPLPPEEKGPKPSREAADKMHLASVLDFSNPMGFGLFKDRSKVAGFIPHQFTTVPEMSETWKVHVIDLIGLLIPEEPVAYVSEFLPRMEELKWAPKRPLDEFEQVGLKALRSGEDYQFSNTADALRMLGAIRAAKQCMKCHGCERGDLLGAFSYTLRKAGLRQ